MDTRLQFFRRIQAAAMKLNDIAELRKRLGQPRPDLTHAAESALAAGLNAHCALVGNGETFCSGPVDAVWLAWYPQAKPIEVLVACETAWEEYSRSAWKFEPALWAWRARWFSKAHYRQFWAAVYYCLPKPFYSRPV